MLPRYWSILANFVTFRIIAFTIMPWWVFFVRWNLYLREWVFLGFITFLSAWVGAIEPQPWTLILASNLIEVLLVSLFFFAGHSLFEKATEYGFLILAGFMAVMTYIDFELLELSITSYLTHLGQLSNNIIGFDGRGAFFLATEASYGGLTLLGFYVYALGKGWWRASSAFALLLLWNKGIYVLGFMLLCSLALLPAVPMLGAVLFGSLVLVLVAMFDAIPHRPYELIRNVLDSKYNADDLVTIVNLIEEDYGSRRLSAVTNSILNAQLWYAEPRYEPYSLFSQLLLNFGWFRGLFVWLWLLALIAMRYALQWRDYLLMVLLSIMAGPISIPFIFSFVFARGLQEDAAKPVAAPEQARLRPKVN
jgi:hypothetical protein